MRCIKQVSNKNLLSKKCAGVARKMKVKLFIGLSSYFSPMNQQYKGHVFKQNYFLWTLKDILIWQNPLSQWLIVVGKFLSVHFTHTILLSLFLPLYTPFPLYILSLSHSSLSIFLFSLSLCIYPYLFISLSSSIPRPYSFYDKITLISDVVKRS